MHTVSVMSHEHQPNQCTVPACAENHTSRSLRKVLRFTTWSNVTYGILQVIVGSTTDSSSAFSDGVHNMVEVVGHGKHTRTHLEEQKLVDVTETTEFDKKVSTQRKMAAAAIAAGALFAGYQAADHFINREQEPLNTAALAVELGGLGLNYGLKRAVAKNNDGSLAAKDSLAHNKADARISGVAVAAIIMNPIIPGADAVGGAYGAYKSFRVSKSIWTDSHDHNHVDDH